MNYGAIIFCAALLSTGTGGLAQSGSSPPSMSEIDPDLLCAVALTSASDDAESKILMKGPPSPKEIEKVSKMLVAKPYFIGRAEQRLGLSLTASVPVAMNAVTSHGNRLVEKCLSMFEEGMTRFLKGHVKLAPE